MRPPFALALLAALGCGSRHPPLVEDQGGSSGASGSGGGPPQGQTTDSPAAGFGEGEVLSASLGWEGFAAGSDALTTVTLGDFHDPDGARGIRALLIHQISVTCPACKLTTEQLRGRLDGGWTASGVEVLQLVFLDGTLDWADAEDAAGWKQTWDASWAVAADPSFTFKRLGTNALPVQVLIDPRTLRVEKRTEGYQSSYPDLEALLAANSE
jgi:hypothetical protein